MWNPEWYLLRSCTNQYIHDPSTALLHNNLAGLSLPQILLWWRSTAAVHRHQFNKMTPCREWLLFSHFLLKHGIHACYTSPQDLLLAVENRIRFSQFCSWLQTGNLFWSHLVGLGFPQHGLGLPWSIEMMRVHCWINLAKLYSFKYTKLRHPMSLESLLSWVISGLPLRL